jgi:hypothetical protein
MVRVRWSAGAEADLAAIKPAAVREQIRNKAKEVLHLISPHSADPADEGVDGEAMWHRADGHGRFVRHPEGPQDYFLVYEKCDPPGTEAPEGGLEFEVLAVYSVCQVAAMWLKMSHVLGGSPG